MFDGVVAADKSARVRNDFRGQGSSADACGWMRLPGPGSVQPLSSIGKTVKAPVRAHLLLTSRQHRAPPLFASPPPCAYRYVLTTDFSQSTARTARSSSREAALAGKLHAQEEATTTHSAVARHIAPSASASVAGGNCCAWLLVRDCLPVCQFVRAEIR